MHGLTLLIVNDEILTADTTKMSVHWEQYGISTVYVAYNAEMAKNVINTHKVDIMLCDIEMPGGSGLDLLRWVNGNQLDIRCIFLTCHASFDYAQEAIGLYCEDYLLMPANYEDIGKSVARVADRVHASHSNLHYQQYGKYLLQEQMKNTEKAHHENQIEKASMDDVAGYIVDNLRNGDLSVGNVAEAFHFHPVYLNRIFKKEKSVSIGQYIIDCRMRTAAAYLKSGQLTVHEVAEQVGYRHYPNFHKMFKKYYTCSPSQYQEDNFGETSKIYPTVDN